MSVNFTQEDLEKTFEERIVSLQEDDELDETELEAVSGGSAVILVGGHAFLAMTTVPALTLSVAFAGASVVNKINNGN